MLFAGLNIIDNTFLVTKNFAMNDNRRTLNKKRSVLF